MKHRPVVAFFIFWTAGMALQAHMRWHWPGLGWAMGSAALLGLLFALRFRFRRLIGYVLIAAVALGYYAWNDGKNASRLSLSVEEQEFRVKQTREESIGLRGRIVSPVEVDGDKASFIVKTEEISLESSIQRVAEKVRVNVRLLEPEEQKQAQTWGRGDRISLQGLLIKPSSARNFGGFDYRRYLYLQHIHWIVSVKGANGVSVQAVTGWGTDRWLRWIDELRERLGRQLDMLFEERQAGFMRGLILGLRADLDPERFRQFSQLGLTHILAVSGLHVAVFVGVCLGLLRLAGTARETALLVCMIFLPFYVLLTGAAPSIVRAGLMGMIALYAARRNWLRDGLHIVCIVGIFMLLWNPYYLFNVSFQLSFLVTIGLIVGVPRFSRLLQIKPKIVADAISVTTVAQLVSFPLSIYYFNQFSPLSWLANLLMVPAFSTLVLPLGSLAMVMGFVSSPIGTAIAWMTSRINDLLFWLTDKLVMWNGWLMIWPSPPLWWIGLYFLLLAGLYWSLMLWKKAGTARPFYAAAGCLLLLLAFAYRPDGMSRGGEVSFLDVGQGDAILIRTPEHKTILIDGGGTLSYQKPGEEWKRRKDPYEVGRKLLVPLLMQRGVQRIDYLIATHADTDHMGGLQAVVEQIPVRYALFNGTLKPSAGAERLFATLVDKEIPLLHVSQGKSLQADGHTAFRFLFPFASGEQETENSLEISVKTRQNKQSVVTLMEMNKATFLFASDVEAPQEKAILARNSAYPQDALDVLKIAHHGSKTSTSAEWLRYWRPAYAVISVGEHNGYGHPNGQVLARLQEANAQILRTDRQGEIRFMVREGEMRIQTALSSSRN